MLLNKTIQLFLDGIGRREEYEFYLKKFQSAEGACFAVICPDNESWSQTGPMITFDLQFLHKLGLKTLVLCARQQLVLPRDDYAIFDLDSQTSVDELPEFLTRSEAKLAVARTRQPLSSELLFKLIPRVAKRIHFVRAAGGLGSAYCHLNRLDLKNASEGDRSYLEVARELLDRFPSTHVSMTSPINLLKEIFTVRGAGTVLRKGSSLRYYSDYEQLEGRRLVELMRSSFGRELRTLDILKTCHHFYIEKDYRGAILLEECKEGLYLSKFAVGVEARGEGLAQELWSQVSENHSALFWRSRVDNPVNQWYERLADGSHSLTDWKVFWRGIAPDVIPAVIRFCEVREWDFRS